MADLGRGDPVMGQSGGRTYRAVARYVVGATDREKRRDLLDGLDDVINELVDLGMSLEDVDNEVESLLAARADEDGTVW